MEFFSAKVRGLPLVGGLEWRTLTGLDAPTKEIGEYAGDIGAARYVSVQNATDNTCGFLPDERKGETAGKVYAIAAVLAGMPGVSPDCVLFLQEGDNALLVALKDGLPAPGFDSFGPVLETLDLARKFIQMCSGNVTAYGTSADLGCTHLTLDQLVSRSTSLKVARLRPVPRPWIKAAIAVTVAAVALLVASQAYSYYQAQKKLVADRLAYVDVDAVYAKSSGDMFKTLIGAKAAYKDVVHMLAETPTSNGGWALAELACQKDGCTYLWKNENGTNRTFVPPKTALSLKYSPKGDVISYQGAFPRPLRLGVDTSKMPTNDEILRDVLGDLQAYKDFSIEPNFEPAAVDFALPPGLPRPPAHLFKEGAYSITGPGFAMEALTALPDTASFETLFLSLDSEQKLTFKIVGKYYVK